jgi:hypothetical protein
MDAAGARPIATLQELHAQLILELTNALGDGGLRDARRSGAGA